MIIYESYQPCAIDINLFKFTVTALSNYLGGDEVYIGYLWTRKIVLGLKGLSSFNVTDYIYRLDLKEQYDAAMERFEVEEFVDAGRVSDVHEERHAEDSVDEHDKEEQETNVEESREGHGQ